MLKQVFFVLLSSVRVAGGFFDIEREWCASWHQKTEALPEWVLAYRGRGGDIRIDIDAWVLGNTMMSINDSLMLAILLDLRPIFVLTQEAVASWRGGLRTVFDLLNGAVEERNTTSPSHFEPLDSESKILRLVLYGLQRKDPTVEKLYLQAPGKTATYEKFTLETLLSVRNKSIFLQTLLDADTPPCWTILFLRPAQHIIAKVRAEHALLHFKVTTSLHLRTCTPISWHEPPKCDRRAHRDPYFAAQRLTACLRLNYTCFFLASDNSPLVYRIQSAAPCAYTFDHIGSVLHPNRALHNFTQAKDAHLRLILDFVAFALAPNLMLSLITSTFSISAHNILNPFTTHLALNKNELPPLILPDQDHALASFYSQFNHSSSLHLKKRQQRRRTQDEKNAFAPTATILPPSSFSSRSTIKNIQVSPFLRSECMPNLHRVSPWKSSQVFRRFKSSSSSYSPLPFVE